MKYEIKKIIQDKIIWISFLVIFLFGIYTNMYNTRNDMGIAIESAFEYYRDNNIDEIFNIISYGNEKDKPEYSNSVLLQIDYFSTVTEYRNKVYNTADRLSNSADEYISRLNQAIKEAFSENINFEVFYDNYLERAVVFNCGYAMPLIMFLMCVIVIRMFNVDTDNNMIHMIRTTYRGRRKTYFNKIKSIAIIAMFMSVVVEFIALLPQLLYGHKEDFFQPIQSLERFQKSPFNINLMELFIIYILMTVLGLLCVAMLSVVIVTFTKKYAISLMTTLLVTCGMYFLFYYVTVIDYVDTLTIASDTRAITMIGRMILPVMYAFYPTSYFEITEYVNVAGCPVYRVYIAMFIIMVFTVVFMFIGMIVYNKRYRRNG